MLWALSGVRDIAVIDYGPEGTLAYFYHSLAHLGTSLKNRMYTLGTKEDEIIFGNSNRLFSAIEGIADRFKPEAIFVSQAPVSEIIGDDLESLCKSAEKKSGIAVVLLPNCGLKIGAEKGIRYVLNLLTQMFAVESMEKDNTLRCNLLGSCCDEYGFYQDAEEISRMMESYFQMSVNCVFPSDCSVENIRSMSRADINLVLREEALDSAILLEERFGIPYVCGRPYGPADIKRWANEIGEFIKRSPSGSLDEELNSAWVEIKELSFLRGKRAYICGSAETAKGLTNLLKGLDMEAECHINTEDRDIATFSSDISDYDYVLADEFTIDKFQKQSSVNSIRIANPVKKIDGPRLGYCGIHGLIALVNMLKKQ